MYTVSVGTKVQYAGLFLLHELLANSESIYRQELDQARLTSVASWLLEKGYARWSDDHRLIACGKGEDVYKAFDQRYQKFLHKYDIYCAVDLEEGDFAFRYYDNYPDQEGWLAFLEHDRWEDLRIAVAEYEGSDVIELIFMNFLREGRFGFGREGYDYEKTLGHVWSEIETAANESLHLNALAYETDGELVSAHDVMKDILQQGEQLRIQQESSQIH